MEKKKTKTKKLSASAQKTEKGKKLMEDCLPKAE